MLGCCSRVRQPGPKLLTMGRGHQNEDRGLYSAEAFQQPLAQAEQTWAESRPEAGFPS